jgi:hypothetical protein
MLIWWWFAFEWRDVAGCLTDVDERLTWEAHSGVPLNIIGRG